MPIDTAAGAGASGGSLGSIDLVGAPSDTQSEDQVLDGGSSEAGSDDGQVAVDEGTDQDAAANQDDAASGDTEGDLAGGKKDAQGQTQEVQVPIAIPKEFTQLLKDPAIAKKLEPVMPQIQAAFDQNKKFREIFPTVAEARAMRDVFPGGAEEAKAVAAKAVALDEADDQFTSGDPREQSALAAEWFEDSPEAFRSMFVESSKLLQARDPQAYQEITQSILTGHFQANRWDEQIEAMRVAIDANDLDRLKGLSAWLVNEAEKKGIKFDRGGRIRPEDAALNRDRENLSREQAETHQERIAFFNERVNSTVEGEVKSAIAKSIPSLLEKSAFSDKGRERISKDVYEAIDRRLKADKSTARAMRQIIRPNGKLDLSKDAQTQAANLVTGRARAILTTVAKQIIQERTAEMISQNKNANLKKDTAGKRPDITGGASPHVRTRKLTPKDTAGLSDDEIMNL